MSNINDKITETGGEELAATVADLQAQLEKVNKKNRELVTEKQAAKTAAQEAKDAADDAAAEAAAKGGDIEALKTSHARALKAIQDKLDARDGDLRTIRLDNEVKSAITSGNVRPELVPAVEALLLRQAEYSDGVATIRGQSITDYATTFFKGKDGAHYVRASDNSGGGATGSDGSKSDYQPFTKDNILDRVTELVNLAKTNPGEAKRVAADCGVPDLI
jgi:hypothetical protein